MFLSYYEVVITQVFKIHSDYYYVYSDVDDVITGSKAQIFECKIRDILKKQKKTVVVGDFVQLEQVNTNSNQAFICDILPRKNMISRPKVANIDQIIIVSSMKEPELDFEQLNRYLAMCEYHKIKSILCFNKNDLLEDENIIEKIFSIYGAMDYEIFFTTASEKIGIDDIEQIAQGKISVLCGASGVGKSTLINSINKSLKLKTQKVSPKTSKGTHTTRHCEIIDLTLKNGANAKIVDTPGFSHLKFDFLLPTQISNLFREFAKYRGKCRFSDCLHLEEAGCAILENIDEINLSRYNSYLTFLKEANEYKEKISSKSIKCEKSYKFNNKKAVVKISSKKRQLTRKSQRQSDKGFEDEDI